MRYGVSFDYADCTVQPWGSNYMWIIAYHQFLSEFCTCCAKWCASWHLFTNCIPTHYVPLPFLTCHILSIYLCHDFSSLIDVALFLYSIFAVHISTHFPCWSYSSVPNICCTVFYWLRVCTYRHLKWPFVIDFAYYIYIILNPSLLCDL